MQYIPGSDSLFNEWGITFKDGTFANLATCGLTPAQFAEIEDAANAFTAAYEASQAAKATAHGLVVTKDEVRASAEAIFRQYAQMIVNNPAVPTALKGQLNLTIAPTPAGPVVPPANLNVTGYANGANELKWNRNGNGAGTIFVIEAKIGAETEWTQIGTTTKTKFTSGGNTPGEQAAYRIYATRGDETSEPSNEAIVYLLSDAEPFTLSEAA